MEELSAFERLVLSGLLPQQGRRQELRIISQIQSKLALSDEERAQAQVQANGQTGGLACDRAEAEKIKAGVDFSPEELTLIRRTLTRLDDEARLTMLSLPLADRFLEKG